MRPVQNSTELQRILKLPRRTLKMALEPLSDPDYCRIKGTMRLWPIQWEALEEAKKANGLFAPIGVGHGKTLISLLLPVALKSKCSVLLVPPQLKRQLERDIDEYNTHFQVPAALLHIMSYNDLSRAGGTDALEKIAPDLIIADEAHNLRRRQSARTKRFLRYMRSRPGTRFAALSGTMTTRSIMDYAHLIELALKKNSPLPNSWHELNDWAGALDVNPPERLAPGALGQLNPPNNRVQTRDDCRLVFRRRLVETPGVVATEEGALGTSLVMSSEMTGKFPLQLKELTRKVQKEWKIGDEEIIEASHMGQIQAQLHSGFHYKWVWPKGAEKDMWLLCRQIWHRSLREFLSYRSKPGLDSPALVQAAIQRGELPGLKTAYDNWEGERGKCKPGIVPVWDSQYLQPLANNWAMRNKTGIIWYSHACVGDLLERDFPVYGLGADASTATEPVIACSIGSQSTGKNLQHYHNNLILEMPANGTTIEQLLGRTHRPGQAADEVNVAYLDHARNRQALTKAVEDAKYMEETTGQKQKILYSQRVGW